VNDEGHAYKPITNMAWVRARFCKLQKGCTRLAVASDKVYQFFKIYRLFVFLRRILNFEFLVFNATFSNISAISWRPVLVMEEAGISGENHRPWASNW
jgi:hypothetical protein